MRRQIKQITDVRKVFENSPLWQRLERSYQNEGEIDRLASMQRPVLAEIYDDDDTTLVYFDVDKMKINIESIETEAIEGFTEDNALATEYLELEWKLIHDVAFGSDEADRIRTEMKDIIRKINQ